MSAEQEAMWGTVGSPKVHDTLTDIDGDLRQHGRYYSYLNEHGLAVGVTLSVMCVIDAPVTDVWPYYKDFNSWQSSYDHHYSGVVGDLEGQPFNLRIGDFEPIDYQVIRVIPEYLIVFNQPIPKEWPDIFPGLGLISPGFMSFGLDEYDGETHIAIFMEHASVMARTEDIDTTTEEDAIGPWRPMLTDGVRKWRDIFIPNLKELVHEGSLSLART
jgi:hypothetical protein